MRMDDHTRVWAEYEDLLERSRVQFAQLRELPLYGRKLWERACPASAPRVCALLQCSPAAERRAATPRAGQYHDAFQLFAALWSHLQGNRRVPRPGCARCGHQNAIATARAATEPPPRACRAALMEGGLKRWEIGDVASRIGASPPAAPALGAGPPAGRPASLLRSEPGTGRGASRRPRACPALTGGRPARQRSCITTSTCAPAASPTSPRPTSSTTPSTAGSALPPLPPGRPVGRPGAGHAQALRRVRGAQAGAARAGTSRSSSTRARSTCC
jgi:hypothetical protein